VKICGLANLADARAALEAGADLLGFILYEKSPRYVPPSVVKGIVSSLPAGQARFVGVFVDKPGREIADILDYSGLHVAQLHGDEDTAVLEALPERAFKALRLRSSQQATTDAARYAAFGPWRGPDLLVDAYHPVLRGGTGETANWQLAADLASEYRVLLAGGLHPDNVAQAVKLVRPWGVDVSSGVEISPGRKDHEQIRTFVAAAKENHS
jgi:phosphoribosylanthranilate isomerase